MSLKRAPVALLVTAGLVYAAAVGARAAAEHCRRSGDDRLWGGDAAGASAWFERAAALDLLGTSGEVGLADARFDQAEQAAFGSPQQAALLEEAIAAYRQALARNPDDPYAWAQLGRAYRSLAVARRSTRPIDISRLDEAGGLLEPEDRRAVAALQRAIEIEPGNYDYVNYLAEILYGHGDPKALEWYRRGTRILPRLLSHPYLQDPALPGEVVDAAVRGAREALGTGNIISDAKILEELALFLASRRDYEGALAANLESIRAGNTAPAWLWTRQGIWLDHLGRREEARRALQEALSLDPERPSAHFALGRIEAADGDLAAAVQRLERARDLAPHELRFQMELARTLDQADRVEEAERAYERAMGIPGGDVPAATALIALLQRHGIYDRALVHAKQLMADHPEEPVFRRQVVELTKRLTF